MRKLALSWTKHIKEAAQKKDFEAAIRNSTVMAARLRDLLKEMQQQSDSSATSTKTYDSPSWALIQADGIGYRRALQEVDQLLSFIDGDSRP